MATTSEHTFHIPVLGLAFTVDTPIKIARLGISSVISIVDDELLEQMRQFHLQRSSMHYIRIPKSDRDHREKRITSYLNLVGELIDKQMKIIRNEAFESGNEIMRYFELLPEWAPSKKLFLSMLKSSGAARRKIEGVLRSKMTPGEVNVNIMTKIDNLPRKEAASPEYSDALSALRGFANSSLHSSVVFSAGLNPRLFSYLETFSDFFPLPDGSLNKKIILKVSDYRSASIQGRFLAKKGLWVSEFRIESGLNCGGHAFPTDGFLMGPILEEFKQKRQELGDELFELCNSSLSDKGRIPFRHRPALRITAQGGIGTAAEDSLLRNYYHLDSTGWGSPFLLVPEATNLDEDTLNKLASAKKEDYYLSYSSPLGVPFHNFRPSSSESQRLRRIEKHKPGSPCYKKYLASDTEFTEENICKASRQYQNLKIAQLKTLSLSESEYRKRYDEITEKDCLCEGLAAAALLKNQIPDPHKLKAVTICPGPNLAYFSGVFSLEQMIGHIYGRMAILNPLPRSHMFINELKMYVTYLRNEIEKLPEITESQLKHFSRFRSNLIQGIDYYVTLLPILEQKQTTRGRLTFSEELTGIKLELCNLALETGSRSRDRSG